MIEGIESLYEQIANSMQEAIPEDWLIARMDAVFYADGSTFEGEYTRMPDGRLRDFPTTRAGERGFEEIRKRFKEAGKQVFGQATFELRSDGQFSMKWGYENCDKNGDTIFDEEKELARHEHRRKRLTNA